MIGAVIGAIVGALLVGFVLGLGPGDGAGGGPAEATAQAAGVPGRGPLLVAALASGALASAGLAASAEGTAPLAALACVATAWTALGAFGRLHQARMRRGLLVALRSLARQARAGLAPGAAIRAAAQDTPPPLGGALREVAAASEAGASLTDALGALADRNAGNLELRLLATSLAITEETGADLPRMLEVVEVALADRLDQEARATAATTQARWSLGLAIAAPLVGWFALRALAPQWWDEALETEDGWTALQLAAAWLALGATAASAYVGRRP